MRSQMQARGGQAHSVEVRQVYERLLACTSVQRRFVEVSDGARAHLLETGDGEPVVVLHGSGNSAGFLLPLLKELRGVHAMVPDRPGMGLSDPIDLPRDRYRQVADRKHAPGANYLSHFRLHIYLDRKPSIEDFIL